MKPSLRTPLLLGLALALGCGDAPAPETETTTTRTVLGDTVVIAHSGEGQWGATRTLVEEMRIGVFEGPEEYQFGRIMDVAADAEGGVYVFDGQAPALRYFDPSGQFVRQLGGEGQGPGEYQDISLGLVVRSADGRVVMRDPRNMRMNVYEPDGTPFESWRLNSGLYTSNATAIDDADQLYLRATLGDVAPGEPWIVGLLHMNEVGEVVDTIRIPELPGETAYAGGSFEPAKLWAASRSGGLWLGITDRYSIEHRAPDGRVLRITREGVERAEVHPDEKAEHDAVRDWIIRAQGQYMAEMPPPTPSVKPFFRNFLVGEEGALWVRRYVEATKVESDEEVPESDGRPPPVTWREAAVYDVFDPEGTFLGTVELPPRTSVSVVRGEVAWGVVRGEFDEQYVARFRLSDPA